MAKLFTPPPRVEDLISYLVEWIAKNMGAKVTISVYYNERKNFTQQVDGRPDA